MRKPNPKRIAEKVKNSNVEKEEGYLYYVDGEGDVSRVPAKWNKDPKFLEQVHEEERKVAEKIDALPPVQVSAYFSNKTVIFANTSFVLTLPEQSMTEAHIVLYSINPVPLRQIAEIQLIELMTTASAISSVLFEQYKAHGTNIILNQNTDGYIEISIIARFQDDKLPLLWEMKQGDQNAIKSMLGKIKDKLIIGEVKDFSKVNLDAAPEEKKKKVNIMEPLPEKKDDAPKKKKNYLIDQLRRIP